MLVGLLLLAAATFLLCFLKNTAMLLLGRIFQGMTSALTWSVALALVIDTVDPASIGQSMGWVGMAVSAGALTAPLLGGLVYSKAGYYAVWGMVFGVIALDIFLRLVLIEIKDAKKWLVTPTATDLESKPPVPAVLDPKETPVTLGEKPQDTGSPAQPEPASAVAEAEQSNAEVGSSLALLKNPRLLAALWGTLVNSIVITAIESTLPLQVQQLFGWGAIGAALIFLPIALPTFISPFIGYLADRYGPKWLVTAGFLIPIPCLICFRFVTENTIAHKVLLCGLLAGSGIGLSLTFGLLTAEVNWAVEHAHTGTKTVPIVMAYALYNMAYSAGAMLGPLLGGFIRDSSGWATVGWSLSIICFVTSFTQAYWIGGRLQLKGKPEEAETQS